MMDDSLTVALPLLFFFVLDGGFVVFLTVVLVHRVQNAKSL